MCQFIQPLEEILEGGKEDLVDWQFAVMGKTSVPELPLNDTCSEADLFVMPLDIIHRNITSFHEYMACLLQFAAMGVFFCQCRGYFTF